MIERADQLVLDFVSKAADAAHGVLRQDHRLDFVRRLRARIESERAGSADPKVVARVLARFGDPAALVEREARRLSGTSDVPRVQAEPQVRPAEPARDTAVFPRVADGVPPGVARSMREARARLTTRSAQRGLPLRGRREVERGLPFGGRRGPLTGPRRVERGLSFAGSRKARAGSRATGGGDATTLVGGHPREVLAMGLLVVAALLVPFSLPAVAIFELPAIVWAVAAATVLACDTWSFKDRMIGLAAPVFGYAVGGVVIGALRVEGASGFDAFVEQFFAASGTMFMIFTVLGVAWLGYRLWGVN
ncbi:hypothetical protein ACFXJ8_19755 [Nonomuraea sp. NPDC059194]|uniref:hypothetical protein n=1 Tax=Nonomuraea sp. NPDC059194 TaxID=3346764 RepID=UPI0036BD5E0C